MASPWEILGVPPGCPATELKHAYARLVKRHRPDKDPTGFRRIRDAYESILNGAKIETEIGTTTIPNERDEHLETSSGSDPRPTDSSLAGGKRSPEPWEISLNLAAGFAHRAEWSLVYEQLNDLKEV